MILTMREAAALARMHYVYFRSLVAAGQGPATAYRGGVGGWKGSARYFQRSEVERWMEERKKGATAERTVAPEE